jgi:rhamnose utilization protein RhaD (predicted bifunctional aldolase and dehydrogenase)
MHELAALRILSARVGSDPLLVQAAGGNTSLKQDGVMWIKASGTWLQDATIKDIFVPVDHDQLMAGLKENDTACETCADFVRGDLNATGLRPSIETTVHALMSQRIVIHVHCVNTIAWAIQANAETLLAGKLSAFNWAFIPYARPGLLLAAAISKRLKPETNVLVLGNHGLVVAAETLTAAELLLEQVVETLALPIRGLVPPDVTALTEICGGTDYVPAMHGETHALATDRLALTRAKDVVFYPDHVVFLGTGVATEISSGAPLVALEGIGVVIHQSAKPAVEPMGRCLADVMRRIKTQDEIAALTIGEIGQIANWDAERYRQGICR